MNGRVPAHTQRVVVTALAGGPLTATELGDLTRIPRALVRAVLAQLDGVGALCCIDDALTLSNHAPASPGGPEVTP